MAVNAWVSYGNAVHGANEAYDRSLYLAARTLAQELQVKEGQLQLDVVGAAAYLFENHTGSRLFYKVSTAQGQWLAGDARLPDVPARADVAVRYFALVQFEDGLYENQPVRLAQLTHVVEQPGLTDPLVKITVAETMQAREQLVEHILRDTLSSQGLLLLAAALLVVWGVQRGMGPLESFRQRLAEKAVDDFSPIPSSDVPRELRPLTATLNSYLERLGRLIDIRKRFLDNAAHQLRTPLTVLKTQLALAQRHADPQALQPLLSAASKTTDDAVRLTEQLLAMTRVEHAREMHIPAPVDLVELARQVCQAHSLQAHQMGADLGLEVLQPAVGVQGVDWLLQEALGNLIDNAIRHGQRGVHITVQVGATWLAVEDNGPGIGPADQPHVFERFYRASPSGAAGSGLGLAIVQEIASQHGAQATVHSPLQDGRGARICITWS
jgi:two-component system sensor histidine kinase TctE